MSCLPMSLLGIGAYSGTGSDVFAFFVSEGLSLEPFSQSYLPSIILVTASGPRNHSMSGFQPLGSFAKHMSGNFLSASRHAARQAGSFSRDLKSLDRFIVML